MMMMITIFIICLMLSVSCDWCKQTPWKILLISSNRHQIDLLLEMPTKVSPSERILDVPVFLGGIAFLIIQFFSNDSILFTTQCDSMLFTQFDDFDAIQCFPQNSMLALPGPGRCFDTNRQRARPSSSSSFFTSFQGSFQIVLLFCYFYFYLFLLLFC